MALPPYDRQRLKEVFAGARVLPASDRQAYLSAACAGNDALRQEVPDYTPPPPSGNPLAPGRMGLFNILFPGYAITQPPTWNGR